MPDTAHSRHPSADDVAVAANPLAVEVTRGPIVESRHRAAAVVVDRAGAVVHAWGDVAAPVYPRSAIKPIQAIPLIESGAADAFELSEAEIALACASHGGEPMHIAVAEGWLKRIGLTVDDLECGAHAPSHAPSAEALFAAGETPSAIHNNCSGKHLGFLTTARHLGEPTRGYIGANHPVQRRVAGVIAEMSGQALDTAPLGIDGCGIPTIAIALSSLATAFARFADPSDLAPARAAAIRRIQAAMAARPELMAGTGRFCTALNSAAEGRIIGKTGAEGVYAAAVPGLGLGVAVKIDDGAGRASSVAISAVLRRLGAIDDALARRLAEVMTVALYNRAGRRVGEVRPAPGWPD